MSLNGDVLIEGRKAYDPDVREIVTAAKANGFKSLADDGVRLVKSGATGLEELMRVVDLTDRMA